LFVTHLTATLDTMGGLVTNANPQDLPEGASPRCQDVDFIIGSVFTRAGLQSVYTFATTLNITNVVVGSAGLGVFTYTGPTPTINESFTLSNFIGSTFALNGQTIFVISVNPSLGTFTATVNLPAGTYSGLFGSAISTTGNFVGPNIPSLASSVGTGNAWSNPNNITGNTGYASVQSGAVVSVQPTFTSAGSLAIGGQALWNNPANIQATGSTYTTISISAGQTQDPILVFNGQIGTPLNIPSSATILGIKVSFKALSSVAGVGSLNIQLADGTTTTSLSTGPYGSTVNVPLSTTPLMLSAGSSSYQWGTTLTPDNLNNNHVAVLVSAAVSSGTSTISVNSLTMTVTYVLAGSTAILEATGFVFAVPATIGVTGFGVSFQAFTTQATSVSLQLLKNGVAVGQPIVQALTTTPTIYQLGGSGNLWGSTWLYSDVNNNSFGVQITASGLGSTSINDLDVLTYISPSLVNFNYVKSFIEDDGQTYTLALDASGIMWQEDVTNNPNKLSVSLSGILPGTFAQSSTMNNREHICFSDLSIGTDRPRTFNGSTYYPLSQCGPGAPPTFTTSATSTAQPLQVTAYSVSAGVVTFTFTITSPPFTPVVGSLYQIAGTGNVNLDGFTFSVLGTPPPSTTQFSAATTTASGSASGLTATATPTNFYQVKSITQDSTLLPPLQPGVPPGYYVGEAQTFNGQIELWSGGPSSTSPGLTITCFYGRAGDAENAGILNSFTKGYSVYVYISGAPIGNGLQLVTGHGIGIPPSETLMVPYFSFTTTTSNYQRYGGPGGTGPNGPGNTGTFQLTLATLTTSTPVTNLAVGAQVQIVGASPAAWNSTWTIIDALLSGSYSINASQMLAGGVAQFTYSNASSFGQATVTNGQIIELSGLTNQTAFNTTGVVQNATSSTFQIAGFSGAIPAQATPTPENGQGVTFGTVFLFDPGASGTIGTVVPSTIFGDTTTQPGTVQVIGGSIIPIGSGIRQGVVYFITETEYETTPSAPFTFTTPEDTNQIIASNIPIGPPDTIARGLAFTEAGQNGVPGANFYVIMEPVTTTVNGVITTVPSTIINDNTTTQISISFTDAVLLNSREIDVQGDDLFNLIELGSSGWCVPYAGRMFYGLQLNKIDNWSTGGGLTFDAGYLPSSGLIQPLGWSLQNSVDQTLLTSPVSGQALYIKSTYAVTTAQVGLIYQTAYQDPYLVAIIQPNTSYSIRLAASAPSGITQGTLTVDLTDYTSIGFGKTYGSFTVPLSSMSTVMQVFTGNLLTTQFTNSVSSNLMLRVFIANAGPGADALIDRIEVFPTLTPYLKAQVYGSYPGQPEAIDASSTGGIIDTTTENAQACMGAFVMRDLLYLLKTSSWYSTQDNPNSEPGGWGLHEVSNKVGTIGIASYDTGEEWCITACRSGIYGFDGGQPTKISQELWNLWEQINWNAGNTIVLRNDVVSKRMYVAIPLPTGVNPATGLPANKYTNVWLPNAPYNPAPVTPNVIVMLNYQGLADIKEMMMSPEVHTTMFGTLAAVDMKRKWTIWNIATPYMQFIMQPDGESTPIYIANGIGSSKIYTLNQNQYSDDGVAINSLYTTYGFCNATKAATLPIFGLHGKRYTVFQCAMTGGQLDTTSNGNAKVRMLQNTISPKYPYTVPVGIPLSDPVQDDFNRPINVKGNRMFVEVSTNAVGSWFNLSKLLITGKADPWSAINPTGGGNTGVV
jgi:hypothetical protein